MSSYLLSYIINFVVIFGGLKLAAIADGFDGRGEFITRFTMAFIFSLFGWFLTYMILIVLVLFIFIVIVIQLGGLTYDYIKEGEE